MDSYRSTVIERTTLTFCIEGLAAREELLVKALIRLLDHLTHQQWRYQPPDSQANIDLLLAAPGASEAFAARHGKLPGALLELGSTGGNGQGQLSWPLRPDALEKELNRLGGLAGPRRPKVEAEVAVEPTHATPGAPQPPAAAASSQVKADGTPLRLMRLVQWPPSYLLASPGRMRLATLLTGKNMAIDELVYRSKLPRPVCQTFVNELDHVGLLIYPKPPPPGSVDELHTPGALSSADSLRPASSPNTNSTVMPPPPSGAPALLPRSRPVSASLLTRIRMRLGIGSFGS